MWGHLLGEGSTTNTALCHSMCMCKFHSWSLPCFTCELDPVCNFNPASVICVCWALFSTSPSLPKVLSFKPWLSAALTMSSVFILPLSAWHESFVTLSFHLFGVDVVQINIRRGHTTQAQFLCEQRDLTCNTRKTFMARAQQNVFKTNHTKHKYFSIKYQLYTEL